MGEYPLKIAISIDQLLDLIDRGHSPNSIEYCIEPSDEIADHLTWIHKVDQQLSAIRATGKNTYSLPGGDSLPKEPYTVTLTREIKNVLGISLKIPSFEQLGIFEAGAYDSEAFALRRSTYYSAEYTGTINILPRTGEVCWLGYKDRKKVSEVDKIIFDLLKDTGQLI